MFKQSEKLNKLFAECLIVCDNMGGGYKDFFTKYNVMWYNKYAKLLPTIFLIKDIFISVKETLEKSESIYHLEVDDGFIYLMPGSEIEIQEQFNNFLLLKNFA